METTDVQIVLALLLINKGDNLNNSYKLMRILEWKFKTKDSKKLLDIIKDKHFATYEIINGIHHYTLTTLGKEYINQFYADSLKSALELYPNEKDIIDSLFESFN